MTHGKGGNSRKGWYFHIVSINDRRKRLNNATKNKQWILAMISYIAIFSFQIVAAFMGLLWVNAIGFCAYLFVPLITITREEWKEIGISRAQKWIPAWIGIIICGVILCISYLASSIFVGSSTGNFYAVISLNHIQTFHIQANSHWKTFLLSSFTLCVFSPLTEELYFRGYLLKSFEQRFGFKCANIVQALCFGMIHIAYCWIVAIDINIVWNVVPSIALIGFVYGLVRNNTKSILPVIVTHAATNFLLVIIMYVIQIPLLL